MALRVNWTDEATNDLLDLLGFVAARNPSASARLNALICAAAERLPDHPFMHRAGRVPGTREAIVTPNYILVYRVADVIEILAVMHTRQRYP